MKKKKQGFACMEKDRLKELTSKAGKIGHIRGTAYEWNSEQAREAALKSAEVRRKKSKKRGI